MNRSFAVLSRACVVALLGAATLAACSAPPGLVPSAASREGVLQARQVGLGARPGLDEAYLAARAQVGPRPSLASIGGWGIGPDGRLMDAEALRPLRPSGDLSARWSFMFLLPGGRPNQGETRFLDVSVDAEGRMHLQKQTMPLRAAPIPYDPARCVSLARAIQLAAADGLRDRDLHLHVAPTDGLFTGGSDVPYQGALTYLLGEDSRYGRARRVLANEGTLVREPAEAEQAQILRLARPLVERWRKVLTGGEDRPATRDDLLRAGFQPAGVDGYIRQFDVDADGRISAKEFHARFEAPEWLRLWRVIAIEMQHHRADANADGRLTAAEAAAVQFRFISLKGEEQRLPLAVSPAELAGADRDGDGALDLNEFVPLGLRKTLALLELNPAAIDSFVQIQTKPWSH